MRAVVLDMDERTIAERHRLGLDRKDEMWEGVLHMVPPASWLHQAIESELLLRLSSAAKRRGLGLQTDTGVFASDDDYRVPDLVAFSDQARSARGIDGSPELVVEVRSPRDESYEKVPWYLGRGAAEVLIVDRDSLAMTVHDRSGPVRPEPDGSVVLATLGVRLSPADDTLLVDGERLEL